MSDRVLSTFTSLLLTLGFCVADARGQCDAIEFDRILPADHVSGDDFGNSMSISGDVALVGAVGSDSAYVFRFDPSLDRWIEEAKLTPSGAEDVYFSWSVSLHGDVAFISAGGDDTNAQNAGAVYVFRFNGQAWVEQFVTGQPSAMQSTGAEC